MGQGRASHGEGGIFTGCQLLPGLPTAPAARLATKGKRASLRGGRVGHARRHQALRTGMRSLPSAPLGQSWSVFSSPSGAF